MKQTSEIETYNAKKSESFAVQLTYKDNKVIQMSFLVLKKLVPIE